HGMILDVQKRKLSKSEGNDKPLEEWFNLYSIDYIRYYFAKEYIGTDLIVDDKKFKDVKRIFNLLDNTINFLKLYNDKINFVLELEPEKENLTVEDQWILSRLNDILEDSHKAYKGTEYASVIGDIEKFVLEDLSRIYIKLLRKREEKNNVLSYCISSIVLMLSPIAPHFTEYLYQKFENKKEVSIHLLSLPTSNTNLINKNLEDNFNLSQNVIATSLSLREDAKKRLRWILPRVIVKTNDISKLIYFIPIMEDMINVERIELVKNDPKGNFLSKEINENLVIYLDQDIPGSYQEEWERSELTRVIQDARKKMNLNPKDKTTLKISCNDKDFLIRNKQKIEEATSTTLDIQDHGKINENTQKLIEKEISFSF
ncbi:MAG: class I tRNA ligase family protein, partial [archaeon]